MTVPRHQIMLADLMQKGLLYKPSGKADTITYNNQFWFNDLSKDALLDAWIDPEYRKEIVGFHACALGFALVGKCGSPDRAKQAIKRGRFLDTKNTMIRILGIPERLFDSVDRLQENGRMTVPKVISILRIQTLC